MLVTDVSMRVAPIYERITRRWLDHPEELADEFAKAWYKLIHRDMGPVSHFVGPLLPKEVMLWQDPVPAVSHELIGADDIAALESKILASGLTVSQLVKTAWAAASSTTSPHSRTTRRSRCPRRSTVGRTGSGTSVRTSDSTADAGRIDGSAGPLRHAQGGAAR